MAVLLAACCVSASACSSHSKPGAAFTSGAAADTCLNHQKHKPTAAYEGGTSGQTTSVLEFLAYFTAHGSQPFCDSKKANSDDKAWAELYVRLTNNPTKVSTILG